MRVVIDTNVLVSGLLSPQGASGKIVDMMLRGELIPCYDESTAAEYVDVLARKELDLPRDAIESLLAYIMSYGIHVISSSVAAALPDPDDIAFLEAALAADAEVLITGNLRHFPASGCRGVRVLAPAGFLKWWHSR